MSDFPAAIEEIADHLIGLRHELHAHPELGYEEKWTAARLLTELQTLPGLKVRSGLAGTGIVATLNADRPGPCLALRADMDALPLTEDNAELPYASQQTGKMHACGHDGHMACVIGAATVLSRIADELSGKVKFVFQPAEEGGAGGRRLVEEEGVLDNPRVEAAFALHGWPDAPVGQAVVGQGPVMAAATAFEVTIRGTGAHAAFPHQGTDVVLAAAHAVTALQSISSRWDPLDPVVVSICQVEAGHTHNVLPESCRMQGTTRALRQATHEQVNERVRRIIETTAHMFGCRASVEFIAGYPALVNDPVCAELVARVAAELFGPDAVNTNPAPVMGAEDFAFFARQVPSAWFRIGLRDPNQPTCPALHSPQFDFADAAIPIGVRMLCEVAQRFFADPPLWRCG